MSVSRYFLAIIPPEPVSSEVLRLKEHMRDRYGSKGALRSPPHITLHMPFDWPDKKIEILTAATQKLAVGLPAVTIAMNGFGHFADRVIFIQVEANEKLMSLQQTVRSVFRSEFFLLNDRYRDLPYHPHMTVGFRDLRPSAFREAWKEFGSMEFHAQFHAGEITLLKHLNGRWEPFRNFPLHNQTAL